MSTNTILSIPDVLLISIVGIVIVMLTLAVLAVCIVLISKSVRRIEKAALHEVVSDVKAAAPISAVKESFSVVPAGMQTLDANTSVGELRLKNCDDKTAAMIIAIICDELKTPLNQLRFKTIECVD